MFLGPIYIHPWLISLLHLDMHPLQQLPGYLSVCGKVEVVVKYGILSSPFFPLFCELPIFMT